jgi:hypothetical protein
MSWLGTERFIVRREGGRRSVIGERKGGVGVVYNITNEADAEFLS